MNSSQRKMLRDRLNAATQKARRKADHMREPMPIRVKKAERVVEKWRNERSKAFRTRRDSLERDRSKVEEAILFGDPAKALDALKKMEAKYGIR